MFIHSYILSDFMDITFKPVQYFVQKYIDDIKNDINSRKYALEVYHWLQSDTVTLDNVFDKCPEYGIFILETMETYWNELHTNIRIEAEPAFNSLQLQRTKHNEREILMRQRTIACIFDAGYRGYD